MNTIGRRTAFAIGAASLPGATMAQSTRPLTIVVAYPAGGDADASARIVAEQLGNRLGRPVVVENRSGASGAVGAMHVARQSPDGNTLFLATSAMPIVPHVLRSAGYHPITDFTPVALVGTSPLMMMASRQSGLRSLGDVLAAARAGTVRNYGTPGTGSPMQFMAELFNRTSGLSLVEVAYRGVAPMVGDVLSGTLPIGVASPGAVIEHVRAGTIAPIAVSERERSSLVPDVPTFAEAGHDVEVTIWFALFGPPGMSPDLVTQLNTAVNEVLGRPDVRDRLRALGILGGGGSPRRLAEINQADHERFGRLARELNIRAD